jgi:hypothetical protein
MDHLIQNEYQKEKTPMINAYWKEKCFFKTNVSTIYWNYQCIRKPSSSNLFVFRSKTSEIHLRVIECMRMPSSTKDEETDEEDLEVDTENEETSRGNLKSNITCCMEARERIITDVIFVLFFYAL